MYHGDIHLGDTIDIKFVTTSASTGAPTTLSGTPVISAYVGNGTTELTAGITLSVDFDSRTGLNNVRVVASGGNGYAAATNVQLVITTGTVGGTSAVGYVVGTFSIDCRGVNQILGTAVATPATAGVLDVNTKNINNVSASSVTTVSANQGTTQPLNFTGTAGSALVKGDTVDIAGAAVSTSTAQLGVNVVNFGGSAGTFASGIPSVNINLPLGVVAALGVVDNGTLQSATGTTAVIRSAASFGDSTLVGHTIWITGGTGVGQSRVITANVGATDTVTVDTWTTNPDNTSTYVIFPTPPGSSTSPVLASIVAGGITNASFAADVGFKSIRSNTAQAGSGTTITLDAGASAVDGFYNNDLLVTTGGTGIGQARFITAYVGATKVATVATWKTNPDSSTTFAILPFDAVAGASAPTAAQVATAVWTDLLAGSDFSTVASVGKLLKDDIDAAVSSRMATYTQPTGFLAATFPGTVASPTNITAGTMTTTTNLTNAPTAGDFTAVMKTSIGTAVAASAVASVAGNVGGNVVGSTGSVVAGVTLAANAVDATAVAATGATKIGNAASAATQGASNNNYTLTQLLTVMASAVAGKVSGEDVGAPAFRDLADSKDVISGTDTGTGNRTAITYNP